MPCLAYLALPLVARFLCGGRKGSFAYRIGQLAILTIGLGSLWANYYLFAAGERAHWTSEGPGMLFIWLAMLVLAVMTLVCAAMFIGTLTREDSEEEDSLSAVRTGLAALIVLGVVGSAFAVWWKTSGSAHSHDADVVNLFLNADETELRSVDEAANMKLWDAGSGGHERSLPNRAMSEAPTFGPRGGTLFTRWNFARKFYALYSGTDLEQLGTPHEIYAQSAAFTPDGEVVAADGYRLEWHPIGSRRAIGARDFSWRRRIRHVVVSARGDVVFLDEDSQLVTVAGAKPAVTRQIALPPRDYAALAFTPSGDALVAVGPKGSGTVAILSSGDVREFPESLRLEHFAFDGPDSLVCGRTELTEVRFPSFETRSLTAPLPVVTKLVASQDGRVFFASGRDVYQLKPRWWSKGGLSRVVRLRHWRLEADPPPQRRH